MSCGVFLLDEQEYAVPTGLSITSQVSATRGVQSS
jgi:hypothetical protein